MNKKFVPLIIRAPNIDTAVEIIQEGINEVVEEKEKPTENRKGLILRQKV